MLSGWHRRWRRWGCRRRPLRHAGMEQPPPSGDLFCRRLRRLGDDTVNPRLSVDHLRYILNDAADEVLFLTRPFCRW